MVDVRQTGSSPTFLIGTRSKDSLGTANLLGLNLDETAVVLRNDDLLAEIKAFTTTSRQGPNSGPSSAANALPCWNNFTPPCRASAALDTFLADLEVRIARVRSVLPSK